MIKFTNTDVYNFENALRGMRNPLDSWDQNDTETRYWGITHSTGKKSCRSEERVGPNDMRLAQNLRRAGTDHRKYLRQILVSVDIEAPLYWWKEFDTYKVGTVANSCSTMHTLHKKPITEELFSYEKLDGWRLIEFKKFVEGLDMAREEYLKTKDKDMWYQLIQMLPSSFNQLRTVTFNYEVILSIYHARKNHKLEEWHDFCRWAEGLPYFKEMCLGD